MNELVNSELSTMVDALLVEEKPGERWFDFGRNPAATERLGTAIADRVRSYAPTVVASWFSPE
ncbi:MAG: hypothetical protein ACYCZY_01705, partial [Lacisediminihabitans sp.]